MSSSDKEELPDWFQRPEPVLSRQRSLFRTQLSCLLPSLKVSVSELQRWYETGWLSFDPLHDWEVDESDDPKVNEIEFIRDLICSGMTDIQIAWLLSQIPPPLNYDPRRLTYSFRYGWVLAAIPPAFDEIIEENLNDWLNEIEDSKLESLTVQIANLLAERNQSES